MQCTNKFKIGDKVRRIKGDNDGYMKIGNIYTISNLKFSDIKLKETVLWYSKENFELVQSDNKAEFLAAIEAWSKGEEIEQKYRDDVWCAMTRPIYHSDYNYRVKPKEIIKYSVVAMANYFSNDTLESIKSNFPHLTNFVKITYDSTGNVVTAIELIKD